MGGPAKAAGRLKMRQGASVFAGMGKLSLIWFYRLVPEVFRLAPNVLDELKKLSPTDERGIRKTKLFQGLTPDIGHPKLKEHLAGVTTAMKTAKYLKLDWPGFLKLLDQTHPKFKEMPLFDQLED